jgi:hypothetical protein
LVPLSTPFAEGDVPVHQMVNADRYQLDVVAASVADVVRSAGGWVFDRMWAGWDVNALVADHRESRPLQILGARTFDLRAEFPAIMKRSGRGRELVVAADLLATDGRVREDVLEMLNRGVIEVAVWGDNWPADLGPTVETVEHRLSAAAQAFKAHALVAAAISNASVPRTETLFRVGAGKRRRQRAKLTPVR